MSDQKSSDDKIIYITMDGRLVSTPREAIEANQLIEENVFTVTHGNCPQDPNSVPAPPSKNDG